MKKQEQVREYRERLLSILADGNHKVYTVLRHVSRSGMQRTIDLYAINDGEFVYLSGYAAVVCGWRRNKQGAVVVNGCGMDMGFHLVNNLSMRLYCPDKYEHDAAYKLNQRWI